MQNFSLDTPIDPWPSAPEAYAHFDLERPSLIIGVGESGLKVLQLIVNRSKDTALERTDQMNLVYVTVGDTHSQSRIFGAEQVEALKPIRLVQVISDMPTTAHHSEHPIGWFIKKHQLLTNHRTSHYIAPLLLRQNLFIQGTNSPLVTGMRTALSQAPQSVFVVASAQEVVGANLVVWIVAVLQYLAQQQSYYNNIRVHVLLLEEEFTTTSKLNNVETILNQQTIAQRYSNQQNALASLYELSHYAHAVNINLPLWTNAHLILKSRPLLDTVNLVRGANGIASRQAFFFLWGILTSGEFYRQFEQYLLDATQTRPTHAYNMLYSSGWTAPIHARRQLWTAMIRSKLLSVNNPPQAPIPNSNWSAQTILNNAPDLLTPILQLKSLMAQNSQQRQLEAWLRKEFYEANQQASLLHQQLRSGLDHWAKPEWDALPNQWKNPEQLPLRWVLDNNQNVYLALGEGAGRTSVRATPPDYADYNVYIDDLAMRYAENVIVRAEVQALVAKVRQDVALYNEWQKRYADWQLDTQALSTRQIPDIKRFALGFSQWQDTLVVSYPSTDMSSLIQVMLIPNMNLTLHPQLMNVNIQHLQQLFITPALSQAHYYFANVGDDDEKAFTLAHLILLPPIFRELMAEEDIFHDFFWCWYNDTLPTFLIDTLHSFDNRVSYLESSWDERIKAFLGSRGKDDLSAIRTQLSYKPLPKDVNTRLDNAHDDWERWLARLFKRIVSQVALPVDLSNTDKKLKPFLKNNRLLYEVFACLYSRGTTATINRWNLDENHWQNNLKYFEELAQTGNQIQALYHFQRVERDRYLEMRLSASALSDNLQSIFRIWQNRIESNLSAIPFWRWL